MARRRHSNRRRRRGNFGFLYKLLSVLVICAAVVMALTLFFRVDTIEVTGTERYTEKDVIEASGIQLGDNLFLLNKYEAARSIAEQLPYIDIEDIRIRRELPDTLLIDVAECGTPLAVIQDGSAWLLSPKGKIVEQLPASQAGDYAVIDGCELLAPSVGTDIALSTEFANQQTSLLALLAALIVPQLVQSVTTFAGRLGAYEETIRGLLVWVQNTFGIDTATAEQLVQMVGTALQNWFGGLSRSAARAAADFVSGAAGAAGNAVVALAASIYLLSGKEALLRAARACLHAALPPRAAGSVLEICRLANKIFSGYIGGQLVDALLVGGETFALMSIFGLEYAPLLAVLVGVTNIVPVLGPFLGAVPGLIILLLELPWKAAEFAIIIFVVQQVDGNFIAPRILGGATGLPGLGVLLAIVVGGAWFGIPGMVLGVPTLAVLAALLKQAVGAGLTARGLDENGEPRRNLPGGLQENTGVHSVQYSCKMM